MKMIGTTVYLKTGEIERIEITAKQSKTSKSAWIRRAVLKFLEDTTN